MPSDFKKLMIARFFFTLGVQTQSIVLGWQMYVLTRDPLFLGLIGLAEAVPALGLALYAGYLVDRRRPLPVFKRLVGVSLISGLILLASKFPNTSAHAQIVFLFSSSFLTGTARAFSQPVMFSLVPQLIPKENLSKASAWMTSAMQIARIAGPALGGLLFGTIGIAGSAFVVCGILAAAWLALSVVEHSPEPLPLSPLKKSRTEELLLGVRYVFAHPILLPALTLDMVSVLFGGVTALLPVYAAEVLMVGPKGLGVLRAATSAGAALTSLWLIRIDIRERAGRWFIVCVTGFGVCILIFAVSHNYWLSAFVLALSGAFDSVSMFVRTAAVQLCSPAAMRGRISAVNSIFIGSSNELGEFESGIAARLMGVIPSAVFGGIACLCTVAAVAVLSPQLRKLNLNRLPTLT